MKNLLKSKFGIILIFFFLFSFISISASNHESNSQMINIQHKMELTQQTVHDPITIQNNADLLNQSKIEGWPGNGTKENPFLIANYDFVGGKYAIFMRDTSYFVTIINNTFESGYQNGLFIEDCSNIILKNNIFSNASISLYSIESIITIKNNTFTGGTGINAITYSRIYLENNSFVGTTISLSNSGKSNIQNNIFFNSYLSIGSSSTINVTSNIICNEQSGGISLSSDSLIRIDSNEILNGGIWLDTSTNNLITNNTLLGGALSLSSSNSNSIQNNRIESAGVFAINLQQSNLNNFHKNVFKNINGLYFLNSNNNSFNTNYFQQVTQFIQIDQLIHKNSSYNMFTENNFLDQSYYIDLGNNINYFDNGTIGNYWKKISNISNPYLVYTSSGGVTIYDYHPLENITFIPNTNITLNAKNELVAIAYLYSNSQITIPQGPSTTYIPPSTPTQPYNPPTASTNPGYIPPTSNYQYSTSKSAIIANNSFNLFIIVVLILIGAGAIGYVYYTKKTTEINRIPRDQSVTSNRTNQYTQHTQYSRNNQYSTANPFSRAQIPRRVSDYCPNCLIKAEPTDKFCMYCGHRL